MRAIVIAQFGGLESLVIKELPDPEPKPGHVVIEIKAFGINHAEMHMRKGEWAEAAEVSGIECVGLVKSGAIPKCRYAAVRLECFFVDGCVDISSPSSSAFNSARHVGGSQRHSVFRSLAIASRV